MAEQHYKNHRQFVPAYHYFTLPLLVIVLVWSIRRFAQNPNVDSGLLMALSFGVVMLALIARTFALKVQDRVIRLEERIRMARVLPADMQSRINDFTEGQLVAMRFASDSELPSLAARVLKDNITRRDDIKKLIRDWKPDAYRA